MSARPSTLPSCSPIEVKIVTFSYSPHAQMTDTDLPVSLQESLAEMWVHGGLLQGALSACIGHAWDMHAVHAWDLLKEVVILFITSTIVVPQVKQQGGNTALPINRKLG